MNPTAKQRLEMVRVTSMLKQELPNHMVKSFTNGVIHTESGGLEFKVYIKDDPRFDTSIRYMTDTEFSQYQAEYRNLNIPFHGNNIKTPIIQRAGFPKLIEETEHFFVFECINGQSLTLDQLPAYMDQLSDLVNGLDEDGFLIGINTACFRIVNNQLMCAEPCIHMHYPVKHHVIYSKFGGHKYLVAFDQDKGLASSNNDSFTFMSGARGNKDDFITMSERDFMEKFGDVQ